MKQSITILGSTGSIGLSTLDVLSRHPEHYQVYALSAYRSAEKLFEQCLQFHPELAVMLDEAAAQQLATQLKNSDCATQVLCGEQALEQISSAQQVDIVVAAIVGAAGLMPTLAAAKTGKRILLANKEALVMSGAILMREVNAHQAVLLPVDSEHNAIWQCLPVHNAQHYAFDNKGIRKIILTASGGPFRDWDIADLAAVTPEQAIDHPNWSMGQKISVDSATMMNKGLEVIEAHWLFGLPSNQIEVLLHRQSIIHSMVDYIDGSVLAQMGNPDMRTPIANTLAWPKRIDSGVSALDLATIGQLDFAKADFKRFPCLALAYQALDAGGTSTAILNAANEVAVAAFLQHKLGFLEIAEVIAKALNTIPAVDAIALDTVLQADADTRQFVNELIKA